jgi:DNA-binding transcriptional MerR regulator
MAGGPSGGNYTLDELAEVTGLSEQSLDELARFGLLGSRDVGGTVYYDEDAAIIAALAAGFARHGIEARHLRMYKNAAERESALFEQIVMPLVKQRNPQARQQAATALEELGRLSSEMRRVLLRQALGNAF